MSRTLYVSTNCCADRTPEGIVAAVRKAGWTHLELSAVNASPDAAIALARELRAEGIEVLLHNYFPPPAEPFVLNLASVNMEIRGRSLRHCKEALELSAELGAPFFAAHAGFGVDLPASLLGNPAAQRRFCNERSTEFSQERTWEIFTESVRELVEHGRRCGVRFLVENHVAGAALGADAARVLLLMLDARQLGRLAEDVGAEDFGILLDVGHLKCTAQTLSLSADEYWYAAAPWVRAYHLSDNDGLVDGHRPFDGRAWFVNTLASMPAAPATLEFDRCTTDAVAVAAHAIRDL